MRTLSQIHQAYEEIMHDIEGEPFRSLSLAKLMEEMEMYYKFPALRNAAWESQDRTVTALYRKISMSREL
ncbi:hypothetical protein [Priestia flexa]|uniref:hypothetical protein n=1 Tax=Priestia flexa TaxID=86664 RepID=UPI00077CD4AA|nr:hypothetical protein [Priestia flexa]MED4588236.1 hypothetical protein [Priestia flexa]